MDELDIRVMDELVRDGRATVSDLSKRLGVPRTTLDSRIRRLVESGLIRGFTALLDHRKIGYQITAFVLVQIRRRKPEQDKSNQEIFIEEIGRESESRPDLPWIEEAHIITGDYDVLLKVRARDMDELTRFLISELARHPDVERTHTLMVLKSPYEALSPLRKFPPELPK
ncbi:MAG: Lrp/AsnC family transcriptional regulator [Candidatus Korarchaeota archaeon NZ13-K]|nr:MAG: Lrp/AsnC family transcriptional regulator [Candidatus Korarchaeota archaeon NZ13-K]